MGAGLRLVLAAVAAAVSLVSAGAEAVAEDRPVSVFLLRHAEPSGQADDPGLSQAGRRRAETLARLLARARVTHLYASEFKRTQQTLAPLAGRTGIELRTVSASQAAKQLHTLKSLPPGSVAVVCGHSNTVPKLAAGLGGEVADLVDHPVHGKILAHDSFDRLFVVIRPVAGHVQTLELRYGD